MESEGSWTRQAILRELRDHPKYNFYECFIWMDYTFKLCVPVPDDVGGRIGVEKCTLGKAKAGRYFQPLSNKLTQSL